MNTHRFLVFFLIVCSVLHASEMHVGLLIKPGFKGEVSFAHRVQSACSNLGWKADIIDIDKPKNMKYNNYDCVISLCPGFYRHPNCPNYLAIFHPKHHFFKKNGYLYRGYQYFDGYLLTYSPGSCKKKKKDFAKKRYMEWYPTVQKLNHQATDPKYLFHLGSHWGNRLKDNKFRDCFTLLDTQSYMHLHGDPLLQNYYPQSYQGEIPYDDHSLYEIAADAGITLVLHTTEHNAHGVPSGRIFEAAATGTVIICDQNSFVQKNFGDSVLYINTDTDGADIFRQIDQHMEWILANKNEALEKAKKAHAIFEKKFLLENQLLRFEQFHNKLKRKK